MVRKNLITRKMVQQKYSNMVQTNLINRKMVQNKLFNENLINRKNGSKQLLKNGSKKRD